jgi:hypothetical protein
MRAKPLPSRKAFLDRAGRDQRPWRVSVIAICSPAVCFRRQKHNNCGSDVQWGPRPVTYCWELMQSGREQVQSVLVPFQSIRVSFERYRLRPNSAVQQRAWTRRVWLCWRASQIACSCAIRVGSRGGHGAPPLAIVPVPSGTTLSTLTLQ